MIRATILVLDDDKTVAEALAFGLRDHGYVVATETDIATAIAAAQCIAPAAIISDMQMPEIADGLAVAILRSHFPYLPILAMSGSTHLGPLALANGANRFLAKPARIRQIIESLIQAGAPHGAPVHAQTG